MGVSSTIYSTAVVLGLFILREGESWTGVGIAAIRVFAGEGPPRIGEG